jgi:RES domain-containing protein
MFGGRWNPPGSFAVLYLALDVATAVAEFKRLATKHGRQLEDFLPRDLFTYKVRLQHVIDLRVPEHAAALGVGLTEEGDPRTFQLAGEAAHHVGFEAILAPSATRAGDILALFLDRLLPDSVVTDVSVTRWDAIPADTSS